MDTGWRRGVKNSLPVDVIMMKPEIQMSAKTPATSRTHHEGRACHALCISTKKGQHEAGL
jgi:hypothetical protein